MVVDDVYTNLLELQNLRANLETEQNARANNNLDIELGTTEYILISMWLAFTTGVFGLLYKITKEADETSEVELRLVKEKKNSAVQFAQVNSDGYQELL